ncbi:hypothetical protein ACLKA7_003127 [Drosophila subpalustris]
MIRFPALLMRRCAALVVICSKITFVRSLTFHDSGKIAIKMPFIPNVPHIVGDDDEMNAVDDQTQMTNGVNDVAYSSASCENTDEEECNASGQEEEEDDEEEDEEAEEEDEEDEEEEEEDWSNNISYIVRTPERVPDQEQTPMASTDPVVEVDLTEDIQAENDHSDVSDDLPTHHVVESEEEDQPNSDVEVSPTEPDSPMTSQELELESPAPSKEASEAVPNDSDSPVASNEPDSPVASNEPDSPVASNDSDPLVSDEPMHSSSPPENSPMHEEHAKDVETPKENEASTLNNTTSIEPMEESRRLSLRSAYRANQTKSELPSTKTIRGRSRQLKTKSKNDNEKSTAPPKASGARAAKRSRHAMVPSNSSPSGSKSPEKLAKPVEVTEYFTRISAFLVSHRVSSVPFIEMRQCIDRLVGEAIAKTKST